MLRIRLHQFVGFFCLLLLSLCATEPGQAQPSACPENTTFFEDIPNGLSAGMKPGMVVTTFLGCLDVDQVVVAIYDTRDPATNAPLDTGTSFGTDVMWSPERYVGNPNSKWNNTNLGSVFGVCLDDANPPNIFVSATTLISNLANSSQAFCPIDATGPLGAGGVYRLDGTDGMITNYIALPSTSDSAGLGQIDHVTLDSGIGMLYVSNMDDGLIYAVTSTGASSYSFTFDHGMDGRPMENKSVILDDPDVPLTQFGRRVWGLNYNEAENRLYYAVWNATSWSDQVNENDIWSVEINPLTGDFVPMTAKREITIVQPAAKKLPVSDIAFECGTRMLISERQAYLYNDSSTSGVGENIDAHDARVLEFTGTTSANAGIGWSASPVDKYLIGNYGQGRNAAGGVDFDEDGNVVASGDALHNIPNQDRIYGVAIIPSAGSYSGPCPTGYPFPICPMLDSYLIDADCIDTTHDKWWMFDVECYRPQSTNCAATCAVENPTILCGSATTGDEFTVTFDVVNNSGFDVTKLVIPGLVGGVSVSPNIIDLAVPLPNGDTLTGVQIFLNGGIAGDIVCIPVGLLAKDDDGNLFECCGTEVCVELPACCMDIREESITVDAATGDAEYTFTVTNLGGFVAGHLFMNVISPPGATISNEWHDLGTLNVGGQITLSTIISGAQPGDEICFQVTMHDATLNECCGIVHCITIPGGGTDPCLIVEGCSSIADIDGDAVDDMYIAWVSTGLECCQKLYLFHNGEFYMWVDITLGAVEIPSSIGGLANMLGDWCLVCPSGAGSFEYLGCCSIGLASPPPEFLRGDANSDGAFDISDVIGSLDYLFQGQSVPCLVALDSNDDETVDIGDTIFSLEALFGGGPSPWPPYQQCGVDETSGNLGCEYFPACEGNDSGPQGG